MDDDVYRLLNQVGAEQEQRDTRAEYLHAVKAQRLGRKAARGGYPSDGSIHPCANCGTPHKRPHGHSWKAETSLCPPCARDDYREVAAIMGWLWPRQKAKKVVEALLEMDDGEVAGYLRGVNTGDADEELRMNSYLEQHEPAWFLVIRRPEGFYVDAHTVDKQSRHHSGPFDYGQLHRLKLKWPVEWHGAP